MLLMVYYDVTAKAKATFTGINSLLYIERRLIMINMEYAAGLAAGIITALLIFAIIYKFKKNKLKGTYDERQELIRGRGYKYAFFTVIVLIAVYLIADMAGVFEVTPLTHSLTIFFILLVGVVVYALYCIHNDSYFGIGMDTRAYKGIMWFVVILNLITSVRHLREGALVDGKLQFESYSGLLFAIAFAAILIGLHVRSAELKREETDEES